MSNYKKTPKLGMLEKLGFGTFSTASNVVFNFKDLFYLFFLTNVMGFEIDHAGIIIALGMLWDAINDPLVGYWAETRRFKNGEKCRPFALWCAIPWGITVVLMFTCFDVTFGLKFALALAIYFLFELFNTFAAIPYNAMGSLATNRDEDRRSINIARNLGGCVGSAIGGVALMPLLGLFGGLDAEGKVMANEAGQQAVFWAAVVMAAVCVLGSFAHYFTTRERIKPVNGDDTDISFLEAVKMLLRCKSWVINMLYVVCYGILNLLIMNNINYYATYVLGSSAAATPIMAAFLGVSVVSTLLAGPIDAKLGRRKTMVLSAAVYVAGKLWFVVQPYSIGAIYCNGVFTAFAMSLAFVLFNTNRNNISDLVEHRNGRRIDSLVSTVDNLGAKLSKAAATLGMTAALSAAGFVKEAADQPQTAIDTICALLGWVPMAVAAIMLAVVWFHPIEKEMESMNREKGL